MRAVDLVEYPCGCVFRRSVDGNDYFTYYVAACPVAGTTTHRWRIPPWEQIAIAYCMALSERTRS